MAIFGTEQVGKDRSQEMEFLTTISTTPQQSNTSVIKDLIPQEMILKIQMVEQISILRKKKLVEF